MLTLEIDHMPPPAGVFTVLVAETKEEVERLLTETPTRGPLWSRKVAWTPPSAVAAYWMAAVLETVTQAE
jgi:hypothetical protein